MKLVWEEKDIQVGIRYTKIGIKEIWMIGYLPNPEQDHRRFVSISMSDGLVTAPYSKSEMVAILNDNQYIPERFVPLLT